jgi:hypothetical protein
MAIRATHVPSGTDITIGPCIDAISRAIIDEVYQNCSAGVLECREHDNDPRLAYARDDDGRIHGAWVHLKKNPAKTKWVIAHSAKGKIGREFRSHETLIGKSDQHQWQRGPGANLHRMRPVVATPAARARRVREMPRRRVECRCVALARSWL